MDISRNDFFLFSETLYGERKSIAKSSDPEASETSETPDIDPAKKLHVESTEQLGELAEKARSVVETESGRILFAGLPSRLVRRRAHATLPARIRREMEDTVAHERKMYQGRVGQITELTQRRIMGIATERVSSSAQTRILSRDALANERTRILTELEATHGVQSDTYEEGQQMRRRFEDISSESSTTLDSILETTKSSGWALHAKLWNGVSRLKEKTQEVVLRQEGARNLKRQIWALDKSIRRLNTKIDSADTVFANNKAANNLEKLQTTLREKAEISAEDFEKYKQSMMRTGYMPRELERRMGEKGMTAYIGPLRRALKQNLFGTLGTRTLRTMAGWEVGKVSIRKDEIGHTKKVSEHAEEGTQSAKGRSAYLREKITSKELQVDSRIQVVFNNEYIKYWGDSNSRKELREALKSTSKVTAISRDMITLKTTESMPRAVVINLKDNTLAFEGKQISLAAIKEDLRIYDAHTPDKDEALDVAKAFTDRNNGRRWKKGQVASFSFATEYQKLVEEKLGLDSGNKLSFDVEQHDKNGQIWVTLQSSDSKKKHFVIDLKNHTFFRYGHQSSSSVYLSAVDQDSITLEKTSHEKSGSSESEEKETKAA